MRILYLAVIALASAACGEPEHQAAADGRSNAIGGAMDGAGVTNGDGQKARTGS